LFHVSLAAASTLSGLQEVSASSAATATSAPTATTTTNTNTTTMRVVGLSCYFPGWADRYAPVIEFEGGVGSPAKSISIAYYMDGSYMSEDRYEPLDAVVTPQDAPWPIGQYQGGPITIIITGEADGDGDGSDGDSGGDYHDYDGIYINAADDDEGSNGEEETVACYKFEEDD
jgi:hypothetical protein